MYFIVLIHFKNRWIYFYSCSKKVLYQPSQHKTKKKKKTDLRSNIDEKLHRLLRKTQKSGYVCKCWLEWCVWKVWEIDFHPGFQQIVSSFIWYQFFLLFINLSRPVKLELNTKVAHVNKFQGNVATQPLGF